MTVLNLRPMGGTNSVASIWEKDLGSSDIHKAKIKKKLLLNMLNQMALMLHAGVSLTMAMDVMIGSQTDKTFKRILQEMRQDLLGGKTFTASMSKFRAFPELVVSMIRSGEENGRLDTAFEHCASILEKEMDLSSKLRGATIYPCLLFILVIVLIIVMNIFVLPSFAEVFQQFGADLPALTKGVIAVSNFIIHDWFIIVGTVAGLIAAYKCARRSSPDFRRQSDAAKLKFPLAGEMMRVSLTARFCRVMASLIDAGVNVVHALRISRDIVTNRLIQTQLDQVIEDVKVGLPINVSLSRFSTFDPLFISMVKAGEESGMLGDSFSKLADLYEQQTDVYTKRLTSLMEPIITIIIAVIVGTVVISIVLPMFGMYSVISGNGK